MGAQARHVPNFRQKKAEPEVPLILNKDVWWIFIADWLP
jgi:hypothetical protein